MIKTIIFDFDGVILDSNHVKEEAFAKIYNEYGNAIRNKVVKYHRNNLGISRYNKFKFIHENYLKKKINNKNLENLSFKFSEIVFNKIISVNFIPGSYKFISNNLHNYDLHISSATPLRELIKICKKKKISSYFKSINGYPQTKKEHIKFIIEKNNLGIKEIVYIGDSINDLDAAKCFNINFILLGKKNNINGYKKIYYLKNLINLTDLIEII